MIIEVKDRGEGVLPEHLPFVFDPFFSTKFNYLGLGLTTAKRTSPNITGRSKFSVYPKKARKSAWSFRKIAVGP